MATLKEKSNSDSSTGVESLLDGLALVGLITCVLGSLVLFIALDTNILVIAFAIYGVFSGVAFFALFRGAAEVLRLLKHSSGVPYNGDLHKGNVIGELQRRHEVQPGSNKALGPSGESM